MNVLYPIGIRTRFLDSPETEPLPNTLPGFVYNILIIHICYIYLLKWKIIFGKYTFRTKYNQTYERKLEFSVAKISYGTWKRVMLFSFIVAGATVS